MIAVVDTACADGVWPRYGQAAHAYFDGDYGLHAVRLLPGEYYASSDHMLLTTVLGSCVATCLRDPVAGVGGMNHFMLPAAGVATTVDARSAMRYGIHAMDALLAALYARGARRERIQAKAFGGAMVLNELQAARIGDANATFVRRYLAAQGIALVAEDLGDRCPRLLHYLPATGRVGVRRYPRSDNGHAAGVRTSALIPVRAAAGAGTREKYRA